MSKPHSPSDRARAERRQAATPKEQPALPRRSRYPFVILGVVLVLLVLAGCAAYHYSTTKADQETAELDLCRRFMALKNAGDPAANDLLGPAPVVPADALSPEEADRLHAEFFLRGDYRVESVRPETADVSGPAARFVLVLRGEVTSPRIKQTAPGGVDTINRSMKDPEVVVRVQDNKLRAVLARMAAVPETRPMSAEEQREMRQAMEEQQRRLYEAYQGTGRSGGRR
jgi:hypothetical protein